MSSIGSYYIEGHPDAEEAAAVLAALEQFLREEERVHQIFAWKYSLRSASARVGIVELRGKFPSRAWVLSGRFLWSGEPQSNLKGRGEAK